MKAIVKQSGTLLLLTLLLFGAAHAFAQTKTTEKSAQRKDFYQLLKEAGIDFNFPAGFREIKAVNNDDFSFDFALQAGSRDFEMWLLIKPQTQNWIMYQNAQHEAKRQLANPDSMYVNLGKATAKILTADNNYLERNMQPVALTRYNADAGKSYLINLSDSPVTNHYRYALVIALQKNHIGTLVAIYFTNDKDPDFYRNVNRVSYCLKFKPQPPG